jgi:iron complex transport system substrate-binding protein
MARPARDTSLQEVFVKARILSVVIPAVLVVAVLPAAPRQQTRYPLALMDDTGAAVVIQAQPVRIVSQTLATDEILLSLVDKTRMIAVTSLAADGEVSNVADQVADIPKLTMNVETIISLRPDIVLVANWSDPAQVKQLRDAGVVVYSMASGLSVPSIKEKIERLAMMTGEVEKGRQVVLQMDARLAAVTEKISTLAPEKRPRVMDYATWGSAQGKGSSWDEIIRRAGLVDAVAELSADEWGQVPLSKEKILQIDPDLLVLPGWVYGDPKGASAFLAQVVGDPAFRGLSAVRTKKVFMMPENLKSTTSQYIASAVEWLAKAAFPELFR